MSATVLLLGGLSMDGLLHRVAHFRPLTGMVERALTACAKPDRTLMHTVSAVLAAAVERIGSVPMTPEIAACLTVGDRVFLMLQIAIQYVGDVVWLSPTCEQCARPFDVRIERSQLSVRSPDGDYPTSILRVAGHTIELRPPCGEDQCFIAETRPDDAELALLSRCVQRVDGNEPKDEFLRDMSPSHRIAIEAALEQSCPDVDCSVPVKCPECEAVQRIEVEPYWLGDAADGTLEADVHTLAYHYHWSEPDILNLPRDLRQRYCLLIDKERGRRG